MNGIEINVTVEEFLELIPIIDEELKKLYKNFREINFKKIESETAIKALEMSSLRFTDLEIKIIEKRIEVLESFLKKFEIEMVNKFEPKPSNGAYTTL